MNVYETKDLLFFSIVIEKNNLGILQKAELLTYLANKNANDAFSFEMISCDVNKVKGDVDTAITEELNLMKSKYSDDYDMFFLTNLDEIIDMNLLLPKSYDGFRKLQIINFDAIEPKIIEKYAVDTELFKNQKSKLGAKLQQVNYAKFLMENERNQKGIYAPPF